MQVAETTLPSSTEGVVDELLLHGLDDDATMVAECYYKQFAQCESALFTLLRAHRRHPRVVIKIGRQAAVSSPRYSSAEALLVPGVPPTTVGFEEHGRQVLDVCERYFGGRLAAFALATLARIYNDTERPKLAALVARRALHLNPFLYATMHVFCQNSTADDLNTFTVDVVVDHVSEPSAAPCRVLTARGNYTSGDHPGVQPRPPPLDACRQPPSEPMEIGVTPTANPIAGGDDNRRPIRKAAQATRRLRPMRSGESVDDVKEEQLPRGTFALRQSDNSSTRQIRTTRRSVSGRENAQQGLLVPRKTRSSVKTSPKPARLPTDENTPGCVDKTTMTSPCETASKIVGTDDLGRSMLMSGEETSIDWLLSLYRPLLGALAAMHTCTASRAFHELQSMPAHLQTALPVLLCRARVYYDAGVYDQAEEVYKAIAGQYPWSVVGADLSSTVLWARLRTTELSEMSLRLSEDLPYAPETWVVVANAMSCEKQHDRAVRALCRAVQLAPHHSFAHVSLGHEYMAIGEHDKAKSAFYTAAKFDKRCWNAHYGLALVHFKEEHYSLAFVYFRMAIELNSGNADLLARAAITASQLKQFSQAQTLVDRALAIAPGHAMSRYHLANLTYNRGELQTSLDVLLALLSDLPNDAQIYVLIGKCYKQMGRVPDAFVYFTLANDLQPRPELQSLLLAPLKDELGALVLDGDGGDSMMGASWSDPVSP